jgi:hypothetical protein
VANVAEMDEYGMLREDWGTAYEITREPGSSKPYRAARRDSGEVLSAETPGELRALIRADYTTCPVSKDVRP